MKNGYNNGYNLLVLKALSFFLDNSYKEIYLREFARLNGISLNSAQRFLNLFLKEGLIIEEKRANLRYFKANLESVVFRQIKKTFSVKKIVDSGILEYLKKEKVSNLVLFGSVARGEDDVKSDIDLVLIGIRRPTELNLFYKKIGKEVNTHFFSISEWRKQAKENKAFYESVISDGISLIGVSPLV